MTFVFDTSAVVAWLDGEDGARRVLELLASSEVLLFHAVNLVELQYRYMRKGERQMRAAMDAIEPTGLHIERSLDDGLLREAAQLKATQTPIALGDTFAVALAIVRDATLITTDRGELQKIADAGLCDIEFLR